MSSHMNKSCDPYGQDAFEADVTPNDFEVVVEPDGMAAGGGEASSRRKKNHNSNARRRRPRKVVYYYSDSDDDDDDDDEKKKKCDGDGRQTEKRSDNGGYCALGTASSSSADCAAKKSNHNKHVAYSGCEDDNNNGDDDACGERVVVISKNCRNCGGGASAVAAAAAAPYSSTNPRIGSPTPIGFFAFGITTLLYHISTAGIHPMNQATMGLVCWYGGLTQFLCGWFELINWNTLGCTISTTYGAFWIATVQLYLWPANDNVDQFGGAGYTGGFMLVWFVFAGTLFACSFKSPLMCMLLFFCVPINFLLQCVGQWAASPTLIKVAGFEGIFAGSLAVYLGMAFTMADVYGRNILPMFPHTNFHNIGW